MRAIGRPGKNICTLSSHRATRELYAKVPSHRAPVGALCEGSMRIELRSELMRREFYAALHSYKNFELIFSYSIYRFFPFCGTRFLQDG